MPYTLVDMILELRMSATRLRRSASDGMLLTPEQQRILAINAETWANQLEAWEAAAKTEWRGQNIVPFKPRAVRTAGPTDAA